MHYFEYTREINVYWSMEQFQVEEVHSRDLHDCRQLIVNRNQYPVIELWGEIKGVI